MVKNHMLLRASQNRYGVNLDSINITVPTAGHETPMFVTYVYTFKIIMKYT